MSWDFYQCLVNDKPASIYLNLGLASRAPLAGYPELFYLRIPMCQPREDGLSSQAEFETLNQIEDKVVEALTADNKMIYVGRLTSDGCRDLFFYSSSDDIDEEALELSLSDFSEYAWEGGINPDPDWETYFQLLMPSETQLESIKNRRVCDAMVEKGEVFKTPREIMHWAYFATETAASEYTAKVQAAGYQVLDTQLQDNDDERYCVQVRNVGIPSHQQIDEFTLPLFQAAVELGGRYDGWESAVKTI